MDQRAQVPPSDRYFTLTGGHYLGTWWALVPTSYNLKIFIGPCAWGEICYRSESYVRDDRGRRVRDLPAHPPSRLTVYVRFLRITRIFHGRGEGG